MSEIGLVDAGMAWVDMCARLRQRTDSLHRAQSPTFTQRARNPSQSADHGLSSPVNASAVVCHGRDLRCHGRARGCGWWPSIASFEPMTSELNEDVDLIYLPGSTGALASTSGREIEVLLEDEPETLIDGRVDLGVLATEFLMLGIDPYPRKPDSIFEPPAEPKSEEPFAALAGLGKTPQPDISRRNAQKKG